jgi:hypothetical protein
MERIDPKDPRIANLGVVAIRVRNNLEKEMLMNLKHYYSLHGVT